MLEMLDSHWVQVGMSFGMLALLVGVASFVFKRIQTDSAQQELTPNELMSKFRDLHSKGELTDEEFRTIKTTLSGQIRSELKDTGETG